MPNEIEESKFCLIFLGKYHDEEASGKDVIVERIINNYNDTLSSSSKNYSNNSDKNSSSVKSQKHLKKRKITLSKFLNLLKLDLKLIR